MNQTKITNNYNLQHMREIYSLIFSIIFILFTFSLSAQDEDCNVFELLPPLINGQLSNGNSPVPCGFNVGSDYYVNECSPCGNKISDDDCINTPTGSLCNLDGFRTTTAGYTNDVGQPTLGFCGGGTGSHNNFWIGFTAQTNVIELAISTFNCTSQGSARGLQIAIGETNCLNQYETVAGNAISGSSSCTGSIAQGGLFNSTITLGSSQLVPGNPYYIMVDGFAGGICELEIDVLDGFDNPAYEIAVNNPGQLCPDILNQGEFSPVFGSGAVVDVSVGGSATTDLTYYWLDPNGILIATTIGQIIGANTVRGDLDGSFFTDQGGYSVEIIDNGSCCPLCTTVELFTADTLPVFASVDGTAELSCNNDEVLLMGDSINGVSPAVEQWQIVDANGDRQQLDIHLVQQNGRLNEFIVTPDLINQYFLGETVGEATFIYGLLNSFTELCFSEAAVTVPFDFRDLNVSLSSSGELDCTPFSVVQLNATTDSTNVTYLWSSVDGHPISGTNNNQAFVNEAGIYTLTLTDLETGCVVEESIEVTDVDVIAFEQSNTNLDCFGDANGSGEIVVLTGAPPFNISGALTNFTFDNLAAGTYPFTITDANECTSTSEIIISQPDELQLTIQENSNGDIEATVSGGTSGYSYLWNDGSTSSTINNPIQGFEYILTVTDANGCKIEGDIIVITIPPGSDSEDCDVFEQLPDLTTGTFSNDNPPVPCGFFTGGVYVNECSPCGNKISDDNCSDTPTSSLCNLDGFTTTTTGYSNDVFNVSLGFCGPGTGTHNNFWIGFTAQSNIIELEVTTSNCVASGNARGLQFAVVETNCIDQFSTLTDNNGSPACFGAVGQGGLFNNSTILRSTNLIPGNEYYIMVDGFAGGVCEVEINVIDGFASPEFNITASPPAQLCPDVINPGHFTSDPGSGAIVDVSVGGIASTDLTFFWLDPSGQVIASTNGAVLAPNLVRGALDGSFFSETGTYSVQIIDNGSCCPLCTTIELEVVDPSIATVQVITNNSNSGVLNCNNTEVQLMGDSDNGITPAIEQWQIVDANGDRQQLDVHLVSQDGRLNEFMVTPDLITTYFPGENVGEATFIYGFLEDFLSLCFSEATVIVPFDFTDLTASVSISGTLDCTPNSMVTLNASSSSTNLTYQWSSVNGYPIGGANTNQATVTVAGTYTLILTDPVTGCVVEQSVEVFDIDEIAFEQSSTNLSCFGDTNGSGEIVVLTGAPPFSISGAITSFTFSNLPAGTYPFIITDANDCTTTSEITISQPEELVVDIQQNNNGSIGATINGGTPGYTLLWNDGSTSATINNPIQGFNYELVVTDANGCVVEEDFIIVIIPPGSDTEDCNVFELLPALIPGQLSNDNPSVPCGFNVGSQFYVNECSPCGNKISDDNCTDAPNATLCNLDGFTTTTTGHSNDVGQATIGFCGPGTGTHNNFWIGFTAQTNIIELEITAFNCVAQGGARGIQIAIAETNCLDEYETVGGNAISGSSSCTGSIAQGGLFNSIINIGSSELIPGNPYYILVDGFAGSACEMVINIEDGFGTPDFDVIVSPPSSLCPDVLNPGDFTSDTGSGATVDVSVGGIVTTDLTFFWLNPLNQVIATTSGEVVAPNIVRGSLDGSFFTQSGNYSVQIIDNGSCCPLCTTIDLEIADPLPAIAGVSGVGQIDCNNSEVTLFGNPSNGSTPAVEQWVIVDANGDRQTLDVHLVSQDGRLNEFIVTQDLISTFFPGQNSGEVILIYGFLADFTDPCFSESLVIFDFDLRDVNVSIEVSGELDCTSNSMVILDASNSSVDSGNPSYLWTSANGNPIIGANTSQASVSNPGIYTLTLTDVESGCSNSLSVEVFAIDEIAFEQSSTDVRCFGFSDGSGEIVVLSGEPPFMITGAINSFTIDNLAAGTYPFTITDANQCTSTSEIIISEPDELVLNIQENDNGSITAVVDGGKPGYTYMWNDGSSTATIMNAEFGFMYQLIVSDTNGCIVEGSIILVDDSAPNTDNENCNAFEFLPALAQGQLSNDTPPVPCGFMVGSDFYVNECSPCGKKIADDNCLDTPVGSLCELDGFQTTLATYTSDLGDLTMGFCGGGTVTDRNVWIGFTAQSNLIEIMITTFNCASQGGAGGLQTAIVETNCSSEFSVVLGNNNLPTCTSDPSGTFNNTVILSTNNLIPGNEYYLMLDGPVGGVCDVQIDILDGFSTPEFEVVVSPPGQLCPDVLNPGTISPVFGSGAVVDVQVGGMISTDLTFIWLNPNGVVIATTSGEEISATTVRGTLDGSFFDLQGDFSVQIVDNSSCCPLCTTVDLEVADTNEAAAEIVNMGLLSCLNSEVTVSGEVLNGAMPVVEQFQIVDANGNRQTLDVHLVNQDGRLDEIIITRDIINEFFPGQNIGEVNIVYGFLTDFTEVCFSEAFVPIPFNFEDFVATIEASGELGCEEGATIVLNATNSTVSNDVTYQWTSADGFPIAGADTDQATVSNAGVYTLTITDTVNGCMDSQSIEVTAIEDLTFESIVVDVLCFGEDEGSIGITILTGTPPYTITGSISDFVVNNLAAGTYPFTIVDDNGCEETSEIIISQPPMLDLDIQLLTTGEIEVMASGGTPEYTYLWNDGDTTTTITEPLVDFEYIVTVTDANGCTEITNLIISDVNDLTIDRNDVSLFPNPHQGNFQFSFDSSLDLNQITIYNIHGQVVKQMDNYSSGTTIDLSRQDMPQGTYLFEAQFDQGVHRQKMLLF